MGASTCEEENMDGNRLPYHGLATAISSVKPVDMNRFFANHCIGRFNEYLRNNKVMDRWHLDMDYKLRDIAAGSSMNNTNVQKNRDLLKAFIEIANPIWHERKTDERTFRKWTADIHTLLGGTPRDPNVPYSWVIPGPADQ